MTDRNRGGDREANRWNRAVEILPPPNRLTVITHAIPGEDGGEPIVNYLAAKTTMVLRNGSPVGQVISQMIAASGGNFTVEGPYPLSPAQIVAAADIPPHLTTHGLMILPTGAGLYDLDVTNGDLSRMIQRYQPTAFGLGDVSRFSPEDTGVGHFEDFSLKLRRLITYLETFYRRPVMFIATGKYGVVVDREPVGKRVVY